MTLKTTKINRHNGKGLKKGKKNKQTGNNENGTAVVHFFHLGHRDQAAAEKLRQPLHAVVGQLQAGMPREVSRKVELPGRCQEVAQPTPDYQSLRGDLATGKNTRQAVSQLGRVPQHYTFHQVTHLDAHLATKTKNAAGCESADRVPQYISGTRYIFRHKVCRVAAVRPPDHECKHTARCASFRSHNVLPLVGTREKRPK